MAMPDLDFKVEGALAVPYAATPLLGLRLRITSTPRNEPVQAAVLKCQVQIDAPARPYDRREEEGLGDLFGPRSRWGTTLRSLLWAHVNVTVPAFQDDVVVDVQIPCTYDLNVAATKYFHSLESGTVPITLLFSGTVFYAGEHEVLQVAPVSWSKEARYALPVAVWKEVVDLYFPNTGFVLLQREVLDRLYRFRVKRGLPTWERALESLIARAEADA
jgi:hypothetical protein